MNFFILITFILFVKCIDIVMRNKIEIRIWNSSSDVFLCVGWVRHKYNTLVCIHYVKQFSRFFPTSGKNLVLSQAIYILPTWSVWNVWRILRRIEMFIMSRTLKMWSATRITLWAVLWLQSFHFIDVSEHCYVTYYRLFYFSKMNASNFVAHDYTFTSLDGDE